MPELPEVETTRRHLEPVLVGRTVVVATVSGARTLRRQERPIDFTARLDGRRLEAVDRHGKFLILAIEGDLSWVIHLGMSGRIALEEPSEAMASHTRLNVTWDRGPQLRFVDPRTFGFTVVYTPEERAASPLARLGPDALDDLPRSAGLARILSGRSASIKAMLLDQTILAGLGNIYADEALHRARIDPHRAAGALDRDALERLRASIRATLAAALDAGGTTLGDLAYLLPDRRSGTFLPQLRVYGREGEPCLRCGTPIGRSVVRARSTFSCSACQV